MSTADIVWGSFAGVALAGFAVLEITGYYQRKEWGTLTRALKRWIGIAPSSKRKWVLGPLFAGGLIAFGVHILTSWL